MPRTQFRGIKGNDVAQFKDPNTEVIVTPAGLKSGNVIYPYEKARQQGCPTTLPTIGMGLLARRGRLIAPYFIAAQKCRPRRAVACTFGG